MGKKKKTYVKPEMKIIEVKTEGVIAASGEIIVPPTQYESILSASCTSGYGDGGNALQLPVGGDGCFLVNDNNGCKAKQFYIDNGLSAGTQINIYRKALDTFIIKKGCNNN